MTLRIIDQVDSQQTHSERHDELRNHRIKSTAYFEKQWKECPEKFEQTHSAIKRARIGHLKNQINNLSTKGRACEFGCGAGILTEWLAEQGFQIDAIDVAAQAVERLSEKQLPNVKAYREYAPYTNLDDNTYDIVICNNMIGKLHPHEYRLLFAELARIAKQEGSILCSSSLDIYSDDALNLFTSFANTEMLIEHWHFEYHYLFLRCLDFLKSPKKRSITGFTLLKPFWKTLSLVFSPIADYWNNSSTIMNGLEKFTRLFMQDSGITYALIIGKRRPIIPQIPTEVPDPIRTTRTKRSVWE